MQKTTVSIKVALVDIPSDSPSVLEEVRAAITTALHNPVVASTIKEALGAFDPKDVTVTFSSY